MGTDIYKKITRAHWNNNINLVSFFARPASDTYPVETTIIAELAMCMQQFGDVDPAAADNIVIGNHNITDRCEKFSVIFQKRKNIISIHQGK